MAEITDIKPQKRQGRLNIFIDGKFSFSLDADILAKAGLKINQKISLQEIEKLIKENEFQKVYDRVLKFFSYRPRSEKELKNWFVKKQVGEETQKQISQKLKQLGYFNDEEFARWWIEQRMTFRPKGARLIKLELKQKGIEEDLTVKLLNGYMVKGTEFELAKKLVEKRLPRYQNLPPEEKKQKLTAFLARRGFDWEMIKEIVDGVLKK